MDLSNMRNIVLIVVAIVYSLVSLVALIVTLVASSLISTYLGKAHDLIHTKAWPMLDQIQAKSEDVRARTAALPTRPARTGARAPSPVGSFAEIFEPMLALSSQLRRRRQPWWKRMLPP